MSRSVGQARVRKAIEESAHFLNPVVGSPSAPLETAAFLDSFGSSLMPRTSAYQGAVAGLNLLAARAITAPFEKLTRRALPSNASLPQQLAARGLVAAAGIGLARMEDEQPGETLWRAGARSGGRLARGAAIGGALYDIGNHVQRKYPTHRVARPVVTTALATGAVLFWAAERRRARDAAVEPWPLPQRSTLPGALGTSVVVYGVGSAIGAAFVGTRGLLESYLGHGVTKTMLARSANAALWAAGFVGLYNVGVGYVGRANEKVDHGYSNPPRSPLVSGSPESLLPFDELGQQGRRYVTDVLTPSLIEEVMGEPGIEPIRTYVGYNSEPIYPTGRAELALDELERSGAFDRSYLLLISPTGTGWVDQTLIESAEFLSRGDIATCCIQYGRFPSFLALQKVALGRSQFRLLLWGVRERLRERPPERRPKVLVFGESLGAWSSSDVVMFQGIAGFDHYGIDRALWFGLPWLAKWSRSGMTRGASELVPPGTVRVFDRHEQFAALDQDERDRLRAVIVSHDNDPIALFGPELAIKRPDWLHESRGRGVPDSMRWIPMVTFAQTWLDAANAMVTVPGEFRSYGHDYRADTVRFVLDGFQLPSATDEQLARIDDRLRSLELERAARIKAKTGDEVPAAPAHAEPVTSLDGVPLRTDRIRSARG